jgi:hypothetical protein
MKKKCWEMATKKCKMAEQELKGKQDGQHPLSLCRWLIDTQGDAAT